MKLGVVILGAGASTRMGRPKLLLPWRDTTVVGHLVRTWRELGARQIAVVTAPAPEPLAAVLSSLGLGEGDRIENPAPALGMISSVRCAAAWPGWEPALTHWLLTLGDQPQVQSATLRALMDFAVRHADRICQPARHGRARHPVVFPRSTFRALADASVADLKQFLQARPEQRATFESDDTGLDYDLDAPADYERARNAT